MVFAGYSGFLHYLQLASHELATIGISVTKNEIPNSKYAPRRCAATTYIASGVVTSLPEVKYNLPSDWIL